MTVPLRILIVEDSADDAEVALLELSRGGLAPDGRRVASAAEMRAALADGPWDAVLSDYTMPGFGAAEAFALCRAADPDLPFVVVSGTIGEQRAVEMMRAGAGDYLLKGHLARLSAVVEREVREAEGRRARRRAEQDTVLLASVVASSDDAILSKSLDGVITSWNPGAERLYGWTAAEGVGRHVSFLVPADRAGELAGITTRLGRGERVPPFETVRLHRDGTRVNVSLTASPMRDEEGRLAGASTITRDIRDQKRQEAALRASEERFRRVVESDMLSTMFWQDAGGVVEANDAFLRLVGHTRDELLTGKVSWFDMTPPEYRDKDVSALAEMAATGRCTPFEKEYVRQDGSRVPVLLGAIRLDESGGVAFALDMTDRKRAEAREARDALILANVRDAVVVTDPDGLVTDWNAGATRLFGWTAGEMVGLHHTTRYPESERAFIAWEVRKLADGGGAGWEFEDWRKDGSRVWIDARVSWITDPAGQVVGVLWVSHDITDRKRAEGCLGEYQLSLEVANARLKALAVTDRLTGTNNRAAFDAELVEECGRATRGGVAMSLLLLDVDHFKRFNDTFGHVAGDAVLRAVAATLRATARASDTVARYGGEEFAVILPDTDRSGAMVVGERFRRAVARKSGDGQGVTVSVGVATLTPAMTDAMMVLEADRGLYHSKRAGRNRVSHGSGVTGTLTTPA
jgi:two-component system cell cycle sensor histidine kinase/response regulator CckA